jgi:hypothetical protein
MTTMMRAVLRSLLVVSLFAGSAVAQTGDTPAKSNVASTTKAKHHHKAKAKKARHAKQRHKARSNAAK